MGHTLGEILEQAYERQRMESAMQFTIKQERKTVIETTNLTVPAWMQYAFDGRKIDAIKALREVGGRSADRYDAAQGRYIGAGWRIGLREAKMIVETITDNIKTSNSAV